MNSYNSDPADRDVDVQKLLSQSWVPDSDRHVIWATGADERLRKLMAQGRVLILAARNSGQSTRESCQLTADDLWGAADSLVQVGGLDVRPVLPTREWLANELRQRGITFESISRDGKRFKNTYLMVYMPMHNLVLSLSAGSGRKLDAELEQPHGLHLMRCVRDLRPRVAGLFVKRPDRITRDEFGHIGLLKELKILDREMGAWAGDSQQKVWDVNQGFFSTQMGMWVSAGAADAEAFEAKKQVGMRVHTGLTLGPDGVARASMENGQLVWGNPITVPHGLMIFKKSETRRKVLAIDTPANYPTADEGFGVPAVFHDDGERVDALENVRWVTSEWGTEGRDLTDLWDEAVERRFSTEKLRERLGPHAYHGGPMHRVKCASSTEMAHGWAKTIRKHLDFYLTGELRTTIAGTPCVISNLLPLDGKGWMRAEDRERILAFESSKRARHHKPTKAPSWSRLSVQLDGRSAMLRKKISLDEALTWSVVPEDRGTLDQSPRYVHVPGAALTGSVEAALMSAHGLPMELLRAQLDEKDITDPQEAQRQEHEATIGKLQAQLRQTTKMLTDVDDKNEPLFEGAAKNDLRQQANEFSVMLTEAQQALATLGPPIVQSTPSRGLRLDDLDSLVAVLNSPEAADARGVLGRGIDELTFTTEQMCVGRLTGLRITWTGRLMFAVRHPAGGNEDNYTIAFSGETMTGPVAEAGREALLAVQRLRRGEDAYAISGGHVHDANRLAAGLLGVDAKDFVAASCAHPKLRQLWMAINYPDPVAGESPVEVPSLSQLASDTDMQEEFGGEAALSRLIERMSILGRAPGRQTWLVNAGSVEASAIASSVAAAHGQVLDLLTKQQGRSLQLALDRRGQAHRWTFTDVHKPTLSACAFCGHDWCAPLRIREVTGYLCMAPDCRRDEAGVRWSPWFNSLLSNPDVFATAGLLVDETPFVSGTKTRGPKGGHPKLRKFEELSPESQDGVVTDYLNGVPAESIRRKHMLSYPSFYAALTQRGVPRRNKKRPASPEIPSE